MLLPPTENAKSKIPPSQAVRYRPGEALRWLDGATEEALGRARVKAEAMKDGESRLGTRIKEAAGVLIDLSKSAYAELTKRRAAASEFTFLDDEFTISRPGLKQTLPYASVKRMVKDRDKVVVTMSHASLTIRPYAYVVAGKVKVPIGWDRNGSEVPYEVLFEEWAARCRLQVETS